MGRLSLSIVQVGLGLGGLLRVLAHTQYTCLYLRRVDEYPRLS